MTTFRFWVLIVTYLHILCFAPLCAQHRLPTLETPVKAMGGSGATISPLLNPAAIALNEQRSLSITYYNRYSIKELNTISSDFSFYNNALPFAVNLSSFGFDDYRESQFRLAGGKQVAERWFFGIAISYFLQQGKLLLEDKSLLSVDIGLVFRPVETIRLGAGLLNAPTIRLSGKEEMSKKKSSHLACVGFSWDVLKEVTLNGQLEQSENRPLCFSIGVSYAPYERVAFYLGLRTDPMLPSAGVSFYLKAFQADVSLSYHQQLGVSTGVGLVYRFGRI